MNYPPGGGGYPPGGGQPPQGGGGFPQPGQGPYAGGSYLPPPENVPGYGYGAPPPQKSAIPKVVGILMIIFAGLGLLFTLFGLASGGTNAPYGLDAEFRDAFETLQTWEKIGQLIGLLIGLLHLVAGVQAVRYASSAPKLAMAYGWIAIAWIVINVVAIYAWLMPMLSDAPPAFRTGFGIGLVFVSLIGAAWPIIVLALMSRPQAKAACNN